jgi:hypothetical protein
MKRRGALLLSVLLLWIGVLPALAAGDTAPGLVTYGDAHFLEDGSVQLTPCSTWCSGSIWYDTPAVFQKSVKISFDYWAGGGRDAAYGGADGIVLSISETPSLGAEGGGLGFVGNGAYGVELDSYDGNSGDPDGKHIAVIQNKTSNHLAYVADDRVDDSKWHSVTVEYMNCVLSVTLDGKYILRVPDLSMKKSLYIGLSAATGSGKNEHLIRNFEVEADFEKSSNWAEEEIKKAEEENLIPDILDGTDLTQTINRLEFAAVCVKVYENLAGTKAIPAVTFPFTDCDDIEVLKAYNAGITNGTSSTTFSPGLLLSRQEAATMLTRVFKRVTMPGWTLEKDGTFPLSYIKPAPFADDAKIDGWAKDSVYFMAANGIVKGIGNQMFAPKNTTTQEEAVGYANATREQALMIAVRMVENLKE